MLHVTELVPRLSYDQLVENGVISKFEINLTTRRFPKYVYDRESFMEYGMFIDYLVRRQIREFGGETTSDLEPAQVILEECLSSDDGSRDFPSYLESLDKYLDATLPWTSVIWHAYRLSSLHFGEEVYTRREINSSFMNFRYMFEELSEKWRAYGLKTAAFNQGYQYGFIQGHPDIVSELELDGVSHRVVLDIKATQCFGAIRENSLLQVLSYAALINESDEPPITGIGFVFPVQREIVIFNLNNWDHRPFLTALVSVIAEAEEMIA